MQAFQAYDPDDTGQVDLAKVMDLLDDHKVKKHGSDTERLKKQLSSRQPQDKHHITFEEFCSALERYADNLNQEFGEKLETASSASGQQHKRVFKAKSAGNEVHAPADRANSEVSSVVEVDSSNISEETGTKTGGD